ncbi:MAG: Stk1 family PASTA domain-containing Ser/Thr kinase [Solirubrobacteraceae bacterium]|nr:Stk1 family PASTA domain-containing Ser/Thr kinase [Solirubrobacteraceae bacterium]
MTRIAADTVIDGRYQVIEHIGTGGMAEVYCAYDIQLERKVALKLLHDRFARDEEFVERFRREASSAAGLQHQQVVSVYDRGESDGAPYIAMEYVDGRTLKQLVRDLGPLDPALAIDLTVQILRAARFAHRRGVIHRDFKPQNVIVDAEGRAKVTDFGIARAGASDMTQTGSIMGTAQYLSPEQAQGHAVNARSDLYSIGVILYELLTGTVPFDAESAVTVALKQVSETPVPPRERNPAVPPELEAIVLHALEKDPADRFADADEFIAALQAAASRIPSEAAIAAAEAAAASLPPVVMRPIPPPRAADTGVLLPVEPYQREPTTVAPLAPPPRRPAKRWPWVLLAALAGIVLIIVIVKAVVPSRASVPNVVGSSISVATQRLRSDGFDVSIVRDNSDKPRNTVVGQNPVGGSSVDEGSTVTLNVSDGPRITEVPNVVGLGRRAARRTLTDAGFEVKERRVASDTVKADRVLAQTPSGNSQAAQGQTVTLDVSSGPAQGIVPGVVGKTEAEARTALEAAGFRVTVVEKEDPKATPGTVLAQNPADGATAARGGIVTITVAVEPTEVDVPNVVGATQNKATETLSGAGLKVVVEETQVDSPDTDGVVQAQTPGEGTTVDRGSTVTITVGVFDPDLNPDPTTTTPPTTTATTPVVP